MPQPPSTGTNQRAAGGCCLVVAVTVLAIAIFASASHTSSPAAPDDYARRIWAQVECQDAIEAQLRAPSTADFPASEETFSVVSNADVVGLPGVFIR